MNKRIRKKRKTAFLKCGFFLYVGFCLFAIIWLRANITNLEYEIGKLGKLRADLVKEKKMMIAQKENVYSAEHVTDVAMSRLGMTLPERENIYFVRRMPAAAPFKASMQDR